MKTIIIIFLGWIAIQSDTYFRQIDYRDSYTGNYACTKTYSYINSSNERVSNTTNYTLTVNKSNVDSMLILVTNEGALNVKLVSNNFRNPLGKHYFGKFSGDSIYLTHIPSSGPRTFSYFGKK